MRESCTSGSVRGASSDRRLYSTLRNLSRTEPNVSLALHDTNHIGGRRRRVALATAIATRRYKDGAENVLGSWTFELSSLSRSRNGSSEGLDEKSVRLSKSADPAVMESIVALGRASFWASVQFRASLLNGVAGSLSRKRMCSADANPDRSPWLDPESGSHHRRLSSVPPQRLRGHAEGPQERATHAFAVCKTGFLRDHFNRVPPFLDHEPGSF